jgi:hypothetical protein
VIGDLSRRRGRIEGQERRGNALAVTGRVPLSEMFGYATDLRSNTQGRATYTMQFEGYEEVPPNIAEKVVESRGASQLQRHSRRRQSQGRRFQIDFPVRLRWAGLQLRTQEQQKWRRRSSSATSRTSTSAPSVTSITARRR